MQIREIDLKELDDAYGLVKELYKDMSYKEYEDLIYDMRHMEYKMLGIFEGDELVSYSGVCIHTTLKDKRHLKVYDFVTSKRYDGEKYPKIMRDYIDDYAKMGMCERVVYAD
ncbi:MAG: GNAT family N-acetyltransferase [Campylobacterales bacterium]|nr:GNAT family N-acetyltransferase [Campylobacterales bacterium]